MLIGGVWWQRRRRLDGRAETANDYVDDSLDTTGKAAAPVANAGGGRGRGTRNRDVAAFHNPMYNEVSVNAVSTPGAAANAATTSQESDHGQIEPAPLASRKDSIDVGLDLSTFDNATPDGMAFGFGTAFGVGDRVEIVNKGAGTVRFVGLHHVEGTYGNSSTLL